MKKPIKSKTKRLQAQKRAEKKARRASTSAARSAVRSEKIRAAKQKEKDDWEKKFKDILAKQQQSF